MKFEHRGMKGDKSYRPLPEIYFSESDQLLLVVTPWGPRSSSQRVIQIMSEYFRAARQDREVTSPFERQTCLSPIENDLRIATLLANDLIYREENNQEFISGAEVFAIAMNENELAYLQVGFPSILLARTNCNVQPLSAGMDLAFDLHPGRSLPPLPAKVLGVDPTLNLVVGGFRHQKNDQIFLLSANSLPAEVFHHEFTQTNALESLCETIVRHNPSEPFWAGVIQL